MSFVHGSCAVARPLGLCYNESTEEDDETGRRDAGWSFCVTTSAPLAKRPANGSMSEQEQYDLLATDGMLVKRPMLIEDDFVLVGFRQPEWEAKLK